MRDSGSLVVATHNLMRGLRIDRLLRHYLQLRRDEGLAALCVQENRPSGDRYPAEQIAEALGDSYRPLCHADHPGVAVIYDAGRLQVQSHRLVPLPRLPRFNWFERWYMDGPRPKPSFAQIAVLEDRNGQPVTLVNFHLDAAGTLGHRRRQVEAIAAELGRPESIGTVACGDTNAFSWSKRRQLAALGYVLDPFRRRGAADIDTTPTHYFSRQHEPRWTHRLAVKLGRLGIDHPLRYDVVCTNLRVVRRGHVTTPESDHDLLWAAVQPSV